MYHEVVVLMYAYFVQQNVICLSNFGLVFCCACKSRHSRHVGKKQIPKNKLGKFSTFLILPNLFFHNYCFSYIFWVSTSCSIAYI